MDPRREGERTYPAADARSDPGSHGDACSRSGLWWRERFYVPRQRPKRREVFCCEAWIRGERAREVRPKSTEDGERWLESSVDLVYDTIDATVFRKKLQSDEVLVGTIAVGVDPRGLLL
jgi:hypothetical protein